MPNCSNPLQCQLARRVECTCGCGGSNHGKLRQKMETPETRQQAEEELKTLREQQTVLKKQKRVERRKRRAELRKVAKE